MYNHYADVKNMNFEHFGCFLDLLVDNVTDQTFIYTCIEINNSICKRTRTEPKALRQDLEALKSYFTWFVSFCSSSQSYFVLEIKNVPPLNIINGLTNTFLSKSYGLYCFSKQEQENIIISQHIQDVLFLKDILSPQSKFRRKPTSLYSQTLYKPGPIECVDFIE